MNSETRAGENSPIDPRPAPAARPLLIFVRYWLPVLIWCGVIFGFSTDSGSARHTSRILRPFLRWLVPGISEATMDRVQFAVRKGAHLTEYAVLAMWFWRAIRKPTKGERLPWRKSDVAWSIGFAAVFAASDEVHQIFVPTREASVVDVLIDTAGASLGILVLWIRGRWSGRW